MIEKRRQERYPTEISIVIESLYKQDYIEIENVDQDIKVTNISKTGVGFICKKELPLDYYFNAKITFDNKEHFYSVIKIIRFREISGEFHYGCVFVGLADVLSKYVDEYGKLIKEKKDPNLER